MKPSPPSFTTSATTRIPDFSGRPRRISLDQIVAIKGHGKLTIRPIRLDDEPEMIRFHKDISEESIYMRYFEYLGLDRRTSHERLVRICTNTPESYAIVVEQPSTSHRLAAILAVGRLTTTPEPYVATFDILLSDEEKEPQLGRVLVQRLIKLAHAFGFRLLTSELLVADHDTLNLCRTLEFELQTLPQDALVRVTFAL
jgi:acetyltransferase